MVSVADSRFKQRAIIEFLVHENGSVMNIHKRLCAVCGSCAVDRSTVGQWAKRVKASGSAETELRDLPWSFGIVMESFLWMWCQEVRPLTQRHTSTPSTSSRNVSGDFGLARIQQKCCSSMTMHALTHAWEPGNTSPKWVGRCCPIHPTAQIWRRGLPPLWVSLKDVLRGTHFEDDNSVIEAVRKWLRR
jgi:hypothetical protein